MTILLGEREREIEIELYPEHAPVTVANFKRNAKKGFYEGLAFHRVIKDFVVQAGDPNSKDDSKRLSWGTADTGTLPVEKSELKHVPGAIAMARRPGETAASNSQFYITLVRVESLDNDYVVFGKVTAGLYHLHEAARQDRDANDVPIERIEIKKVEIIRSSEKRPTAPISHTRQIDPETEDEEEEIEAPRKDSTATKMLKRIW